MTAPWSEDYMEINVSYDYYWVSTILDHVICSHLIKLKSLKYNSPYIVSRGKEWIHIKIFCHECESTLQSILQKTQLIICICGVMNIQLTCISWIKVIMNKAIGLTLEGHTFIKPLDQHMKTLVQGHLHSMSPFSEGG